MKTKKGDRLSVATLSQDIVGLACTGLFSDIYIDVEHVPFTNRGGVTVANTFVSIEVKARALSEGAWSKIRVGACAATVE